MRTKSKSNLMRIAALIFIAAVFFAAAFAVRPSFVRAASDADVEARLFLPATALEYKKLVSPISAYSDNEVTAVIENDSDHNVLTVFVSDKQPFEVTDQLNLTHVKKLKDDVLLFAAHGELYTINLSDNSVAEMSYEGNNKYGTAGFDASGNFIVTVLNTNMALYRYDGEKCTLITHRIVRDKSPVAINDGGFIFFVDESGHISRFSVNDPISSLPVQLTEATPTQMIADDGFIYYLLNDEVYRLSVTGGVPEKLTLDGDEHNDLGNLKSPSGISFKGKNLLISDTSINAVQEFEISGATLTFTGFAIAKDLTAYNRVTARANDVEKYGDTVAVLDDHKLTLIDASEPFDAYDRNNYTEYYSDAIGTTEMHTMPTSFALGKDHALLSYNHGNVNGVLKLLNLADGTLGDIGNPFNSAMINDICYQSGYFYALTSTGIGSGVQVYCAKETSDGEAAFSKIAIAAPPQNATIFTVDVFKNIIFYGGESVVIYYANDNYAAPKTVCSADGVKKLASDMGGAIFALKATSVLYSRPDDESWKTDELTLTAPEGATAKAFAMDFIKKDVFFIYDSEEFIFDTAALPNFALCDFNVTDEYVTTAPDADLEKFEAFTPEEGANVYSVEKSDDVSHFNYLGLIEEREDYALICRLTETDAFGRSMEIMALAGKTHVAVINSAQAVKREIQFTPASGSAWTTTAVNMYYLPISTPDDGYALSNGEVKERLDKNVKIDPITTFSFLGSDFCYARAEIDGVTRTGYVPSDFLVDVLNENFEWDKYSSEKVWETDVYADENMTEKIASLPDGTTVRLMERTGDKAKIAFVSDGTVLIGYVYANAIKNDPAVSVRNILIILVVAASVCGTSTYFLLRRKSENKYT